MTDKEKFYDMTKPMKFRFFKMCKQTIVLWFEGIRELTIHNFNYLLYKLNILKRYSYRDNVVKEYPMFFLGYRTVQSDYFSGVVKTRLISHKNIDMDYFYYKKKDGSIKITLTLKNHEEEELFADSRLENIKIKVGDTWYNVDNLPVFKVASIVEQKPVEYIDKSLERPIEPRVIEYDISKLKGLTHRTFIGRDMSPSDISEGMYKFYYNHSCDEFKDTLSRLTLSDIMK